MDLTADAVVADLRAVADPAAHPNRHYAGSGEVLGVRMGTLFDVAKRYTAMPLDEVHRLLDEPAYEPRLAAFCVLDFAVRAPRVTDAEREARYRAYLDRHDRIDTWDMVDRAAPRVVGVYLRDRSREPLFELARSDDPLRRRTALTASLAYTRPPHPAGIADLLRLVELLHTDPARWSASPSASPSSTPAARTRRWCASSSTGWATPSPSRCGARRGRSCRPSPDAPAGAVRRARQVPGRWPAPPAASSSRATSRGTGPSRPAMRCSSASVAASGSTTIPSSSFMARR